MKKKFQESELIWKNLTLTVENKFKIFENVNGQAHPATMTALMGPSGAGKTTLMNAIAGRIQPNMKLDGEILLNSKPRDEKIWPVIIGYVEQELYAYKFQTVYETLLFAYQIKFGNKTSSLETKNKINDIINLLGLANSTDTFMSRLSGGEIKRVAIGIELLGDPPILFCDEPTSGLDSFNALNVLSVLKNLARQGKTIVVTIHQPSFEMLKMFDEMLLLSKGKMIFNGKIDDCIKFFNNAGYKVPEMTNPADFFLNQLSLDTRTNETIEKCTKKINHMRKEWLKIEPQLKPSINEDVKPPLKKKANFWTMVILFYRNISDFFRNKKYLKIKVIQQITKILVFGLPYLQIGYSVDSINTRFGAITFIIINSLFGIVGPIFNVFPEEKKIINRERHSGMYSGISAYLAKYISEAPVNLFFEFFFITAVYWMIGLKSNFGSFIIFLIIIFSLILWSVSFGLTISTVSPNKKIAQVLGSTIIIIYTIYSGSFGNPETMPAWLRWIVWISPAYYATKACMQNQYNNVTFTTSGSSDGVPGEAFLEERGLNGTGIWPCIFAIWGLTGAYIIFGAVALHYLTRGRLRINNRKERV